MKIGVDVGGSHVALGVVDEKGEILEKEEMYIKSKENICNQIEEFLAEKVMQLSLKYDIEGIGIAIPGTVSENKIIKVVNLEIYNYNLAERLESILNIKVKLKNDAKCAALAELKYGELVGYNNSIFLGIGTGVGGAVIYNGNLLEPEGVPGYELGHIVIQKNGILCNCGKRGCFETYASIKRFKELISREYNLNTLDGDIIRAYIRESNEDWRIKYLINNYIEDLSIGISNFINIFEPEAICIGGSFSEYENIFGELLKKRILSDNLLFNKRDDIIIKYAKLKNDAGIIGAALI